MDALSGSGPSTSLRLFLQLTSHLEFHDRREKAHSIPSMAETEREGIDADYELPLASVDASCAERLIRYLPRLRTYTTSMSARHGSKQ